MKIGNCKISLYIQYYKLYNFLLLNNNGTTKLGGGEFLEGNQVTKHCLISVSRMQQHWILKMSKIVIDN